MPGTSIVGISLVRNEDIFIERALCNAMSFCDKIIVADHMSSDDTWEIVQSLAKKTGKLECVRIRRTEESHELIADYAGTNTWIFGIDGDEIYDPVGLTIMRGEILEGRYERWWQIYGNVLNCITLDDSNKKAEGYLAPPCRSMVKLYNFAAISEWQGPCKERLHGDGMLFRSPYSIDDRLHLHQQLSWEQANLRCLHLCFLRRSSRERPGQDARKNIMEQINAGFWRHFLGRTTKGISQYKKKKYMRGPCLNQDISPFLPGDTAQVL